MKVQFILQGDGVTNFITVISDDINMSLMTKLFALRMSSKTCENELFKLSQMPNVKIDFSRDDIKFQGEWVSELTEIRVKNNLS